MKVTIRLCELEDISQMLPLIAQLGYPATQVVLEKRFKNFISFEGYGVALACCNDLIVGWVAWSKSVLFITDTTRIHIEALVIDQHHRGQGIGEKLMRFVEKIAMRYGPTIIDLTSGKRRAQDRTHDFYKKIGYHNEGDIEKVYLRKTID